MSSQKQLTFWPTQRLPAPQSRTEDTKCTVNPAMIRDFPDQHSITRIFEFWTETFWMTHGSVSSHSVALWLMPRGSLTSRFKDAVVGGAVFPLAWVSPKRWPPAHSRQAKITLSFAAAEAETALWCSAWKTPFQRILIAGGQVDHWCPHSSQLPGLFWSCGYYSAQLSLTKAIYCLPSMKAERPDL